MSEFYPYNYKGYPEGLEYPWTFPMPSKKEGDKRWQAIRKSMKTHNLDCLIAGVGLGYMITMPNHIYYISNYVPFATVGTFIVFPLEGEPQMVVSNFIGPQFLHIASEVSWIKDIVGSLNPAQDIVVKIKQLKLEQGRLGIIMYNGCVFPASIYDVLRESLPAATFEDATAPLCEAMDEVTRTSEEELAFLKKACEILDLACDAIAKTMRKGVKEYELWAEAERVIINNGGWYPHFLIGTSGPRPIFLRAPASHNTLNPGDIALFEINSNYGGVAPQISCAFSLGQPDNRVAKMYDFCGELYDYALAELEKHRTFMDIEMDIVNRIHDASYEPATPQIHMYNMSMEMPMNSTPQPGDYFTVHPNLCTKEYTVSAKFGDTVRIAENGKVERMQKTPAKLQIIPA